MGRMSTLALEKAAEKTNGQIGLARAINARLDELDSTLPRVRQGHIWSWLKRTKTVPPEYAPIIEDVSGVPCDELCSEFEWSRGDDGRALSFTTILTQ
jgi:hypothetical protein